jgi:predicted transcriptional regulator
MTTVTLQLDEELLARVRLLAEKRSATIDDVVAEALNRMEPEEDRAAGFLAAMEQFKVNGITIPIVSREERNERR